MTTDNEHPVPTLVDSETAWEHPTGMFRVVANRWRDHASDETYVRTGVYMGYPGAVVVLPVTEDGLVLFVRQFRPVVNRVMLELPAGRIDVGETPAEAALRELREEGGVKGQVRELASPWVSPGWCDEQQHFFVASGLRPDASAEQDKFEDARAVYIPSQQIPDLIASGELADSKSLALLGVHMLVSRWSV